MSKQFLAIPMLLLFGSIASAEEVVPTGNILAQAAIPAKQAPTTETSASASTLPNELKGRWYSPSGQYSQTINLKKVDGRWLLTWWKIYPTACAVENAPVSVKSDASGGIEVSLNNYECMVSLNMKLAKEGDEFKGTAKVESTGAGKASANVVLR